jgi:hypothetical protein
MYVQMSNKGVEAPQSAANAVLPRTTMTDQSQQSMKVLQLSLVPRMCSAPRDSSVLL